MTFLKFTNFDRNRNNVPQERDRAEIEDERIQGHSIVATQ
jgi:hypothetical protein